jgi:hypothetical protein
MHSTSAPASIASAPKMQEQQATSISPTAETTFDVHVLLLKIANDPNAIFAGAVALFTLALVIVGFKQAVQLRNTVQATKDSAAALPRIERAYVFCRAHWMAGPISSPMNATKVKIALLVPNLGRTPAVITELSYFVELSNRLPPTLPANLKQIAEATGFALATYIPGTIQPSFSVEFEATQKEWQAFVSGSDMKLVCGGILKYEDVLGETRTTTFCDEMRASKGDTNFHAAPVTALNSRT